MFGSVGELTNKTSEILLVYGPNPEPEGISRQI